MPDLMPKPAAAVLAFCAAVLALGAAPAPAAGPQTVTAMYSPDAVFAIELSLPPASLAQLEAEPESDEYVEGSFAIAASGGRPDEVGAFTAPQKVEVRLKGSVGSFREMSEKAAFKLRFPKSGPFLGLRRMTLNNMVQDPSMLHETLAYELFRRLDVPASRTGYAFLRINGVPYGVYLNLETLDDVALPRWFASTRHLYEADLAGTDVTPGGAAEFEVDEGDEGDISDLEALIVAANDTEGDWSEGMAAVADLDEMTRMWAVERYAGHWDGYAGTGGGPRPNNYYLHSLDSGVFAMVPWGTDQTWDETVGFGEPAGGALFDACLADASCEALYREALTEVAAAAPELDLDATAICTADLLAPWQALEGPGRREFEIGEIEAGVIETRSFVATRPAELAGWLGAEPPAPSSGSGPCRRGRSSTGPSAQPSAPGPPEPAALGPAAPSLRLLGVRLRRGTVVVRLSASASGELRLRGWVGPPAERARICAVAASVAAAPQVLLCKLSQPVRELRARRPLSATFAASLTLADGSTASVGARLALPRLGTPGRRH